MTQTATELDLLHQTVLSNWRIFAMDGSLLGFFMISACVSVVVLEHPASPIHRWIESAFLRRAIIGAMMGVTTPLCNLLRQLAAVIAKLTDAQYTQKPVGVVPSSVGGHVRHCLEHVRALLTAVESGELDYDSRQRGTPVENSRCCAISEIDELISHLQHLHGDVIDNTLNMSVILAADGEPIRVQTTVGRELAFVLSHTVHHNALVGAMVRTLGGWLPDRFGYAPATLKHMGGSCAR